MIEILDQWDKELMLWMNYDGGAIQDSVWYFLSGKFTWIPLYLLLLWQLWRHCSIPAHPATPKANKCFGFQWKPFAMLLVITVLVVVLSDQIASGLFKNWICRPRPSREDSGISQFIHIVNGYRGGHYGFVSSHASNTMGIALWFSLLLRKRWLTWLLSLWVLLNCYSRIYLGVHYPGDILGGLIVGILSALFCYYVIYIPCKKGKLPFWSTIFENIF